jgi:HSP20 family protein
LLIDVEVSGVYEKNIGLHLDSDGTLTIQGNKSHEKETKDKAWHRVERSYGSFQRILTLPDDVNQEQVQATFKNGVLKIDIARLAQDNQSSAKKIDIKYK